MTILWLSAASGFLIEATSWRGMFIIEGLPAIAWAFVFRARVRDDPADARWLPEQERKTVEGTIAAEQSGLPPSDGKGRPVIEALRNPAVLKLSPQYLLWTVDVYGFVF